MSWVFHTKKRSKSPSHPLALAPCARDTCVHKYKYKAMETSRLPTPPLSPSSTRLFDPLDPLHPNRVIAHFDLDCFYCQVERQLDGSLRDRPTGVCQYDPFEKDGVRTRDAATDRKTHLSRPGANNSLIAVSYEARKQGVKRNMTIREARRCCPVRLDAAFVCVLASFFLSLAHANFAVLLSPFHSLFERSLFTFFSIDARVRARSSLAMVFTFLMHANRK